MMDRRRLIAGHWKMNGTAATLGEAEAIARAATEHPAVDVVLCVPATLVARAAAALPSLAIGGQDVHANTHGAHTGCTSAAMLVDAGARLVIVGHSERRQDQHESDADVRAKAEAALAAGLSVILCVGESEVVRDSGEAVAHVVAQLAASLPAAPSDPSRLSIAYEPIWAIGTGKVAGVTEIHEMHAALRDRLVGLYGDVGRGMRLLYGGSVKAGNAAEIFAVPDVDGALVGGASLTADDFIPIIAAADASR
jgi:triosephosphate isomerase